MSELARPNTVTTLSGLGSTENAALDLQQVELFARLAGAAGDVTPSCGEWTLSSLSEAVAQDSEPVAAAMHHRWLTLLCCLQGRQGSAEVYLPGSSALPPAVPGPAAQTGDASHATQPAPVPLLEWNGRSFERPEDVSPSSPPSDGSNELPAPPSVVADSFPVSAPPSQGGTPAPPADFFDAQLQGLLMNPLDTSSHHSGKCSPFVRTQGGVPVWAGRTTLDGAILSIIRDCIVLSKVALPRQHQGSSTPPVRSHSGLDEADIPTPPRLVKSTSSSSTAAPVALHATREGSFPRTDISYPVVARKLDFVHLPVLKRTLELMLSRRLGCPSDARGGTPPGEAGASLGANGGAHGTKLDAVALVTLIGSYPFLQLTLDGTATTVSNLAEEARRMTRASVNSAPQRAEATSARERRRARKRLGLPPALQRRVAVRFAGWLRNAHKYKSKMSRFSRASDAPSDGSGGSEVSLGGKGWRHPFAMSLTDLLLPAELSQPLVTAALRATAGSKSHADMPAPGDGAVVSFGTAAVQLLEQGAASAPPAPLTAATCWRWQLLRERLESLLSSAPQGVLSGSVLLSCYGSVWGQALALGSFGFASLQHLLQAADDLFVVQTWQNAATSDPDLCSELMRGAAGDAAAPSIPDDFSVAVIGTTRTAAEAQAAALRHATCSCAAHFAPWLLPVAADAATPSADTPHTSALLDAGDQASGVEGARTDLYASLSTASAERKFEPPPCSNFASYDMRGRRKPAAQRERSVSGQAEAEGLMQAGQLDDVPSVTVHAWCVYLWGMYQCICKLAATKSEQGGTPAEAGPGAAAEDAAIPEHSVTPVQLRFKAVRQALNDAGLGPPAVAPVLFPGSAECVPYSKLRLAFVAIMQSIPWAQVGSDPETKGRIISVPHMPLPVRAGAEAVELDALGGDAPAVVKSWVAAVASTCAAAASSQHLQPDEGVASGAATPSEAAQATKSASPKLPAGVSPAQVARAQQVVAAQLKKLAGEQTQVYAAHMATSDAVHEPVQPSSAALSRALNAAKLGLQPADVPMHALGLQLKDNSALKETKMRLKTFITSLCGQFATLHVPSGATSTLYARLVGLPPPLPLTAQQSDLQRAKSIPGLLRSRSAVDGQEIPSSPSTFLLGVSAPPSATPGVPSQLGTASPLLLQVPAPKEDTPATPPVADATAAREGAIAAVRRVHATLREQLRAAWQQRLCLLQKAGVLGTSTAGRHSSAARARDQPESVTGPVDDSGVPVAGFVSLPELGLRLLSQGIVMPAGARLGTWLVQQSMPLEVATAGDGSMWVRTFAQGSGKSPPRRLKGSVLSAPAARACGVPPPRPDYTGSMVNSRYEQRERGSGATGAAGESHGGPALGAVEALPLADAWSRVLTREELPARYYVHGRKIGFDEDAQNEFKEGLLGGADKAIPGIAPKYIVSFLNGAGGTLYFGVTDDGVVQGVYVNREQRDRINLARDTMMQNRIGPPGTWTQVAHPVFVPVFQAVPGDQSADGQFRAIPDTFVIQFHVQRSPNPAILHYEVKSAGTVARGGAAGAKGKSGSQSAVKFMYWVRHAASTRRMEDPAEFQEVSVQLQNQESVQFSEGRGDKGYGAMGASCVLTLRLGQTPIKPNGIAVVVTAVHGSSPISAIVKPGSLLLKVNGAPVDGASLSQLKKRLAAGQERRLLLFAPLPAQPAAAKPAAASAPQSYAAAASAAGGAGTNHTGAAGVSAPTTDLHDVDVLHASGDQPPPAWKARIMGGGVGGVRHAPAASDEPTRLAQPMQRLAAATNHGNRVAWGASGVRRALARAVGRKPANSPDGSDDPSGASPRRFAGMGYQKRP